MSPASVFAKNNTALITGGASGVGLAVATLCRKHGMKLAIVDNNSDYLAKAKESLGEKGSDDVETYQIDVSQIDQWKSLKEKVQQKFKTVDFLMLNAGIGLKGEWEDADYFKKVSETCPQTLYRTSVDWSLHCQIMDVNLFGVINGLNTFVPLIQGQDKSKQSAIVITGSKQGITNPPGNAAYNASKSAVKTLAEHLSYDMKGSNTSVHLLVPGWTFTGLVCRTSTAGNAENADR